jgi:hypothetical protein
VYVLNSQRKTALENIYNGVHGYCSEDSIVHIMDGDDEYLGKNVLKIFNAAYQKLKGGVIYSNFYGYNQGVQIVLGFTLDYDEDIKRKGSYRTEVTHFSQLRTFRQELFTRINKTSFLDEEEHFFTIAYDIAMFYSLMELACARVHKIPGYHYLYNMGTGLNDYQVDRVRQFRTS